MTNSECESYSKPIKFEIQSSKNCLQPKKFTNICKKNCQHGMISQLNLPSGSSISITCKLSFFSVVFVSFTLILF